MTNTPIYRIPLEEMTENQIINSEIDSLGESIENAMTMLIDHSDDENALSITMDWAMQLREKTGHSWGDCIRVAMIAYFG